jgi:hypothetical protein
VGHQRRRPPATQLALSSIPSLVRGGSFFLSMCSRLEQRISELKKYFSPPKRPTEGFWCGKLRSAARYHQLSELSQKNGAAIIHARHCMESHPLRSEFLSEPDSVKSEPVVVSYLSTISLQAFVLHTYSTAFS